MLTIRSLIVPVMLAAAGLGGGASAEVITATPPAPKVPTASDSPPGPIPPGAGADAVGAIGTAAGGAQYTYDAAMLAAPPMPKDAAKQAKSFSNFLETKGKVIDAARIGEGLYRGDTAPMYEVAAERTIDAGVEAMCAGAGPAGPPCMVAYGTGKLIGGAIDYYYGNDIADGIDYATEYWTGKPLSQHIYEYNNPTRSNSDRSSLRNRFESKQSSNDAYVLRESARRQDYDSYNDGGADFMNAIMAGTMLGPTQYGYGSAYSNYAPAQNYTPERGSYNPTTSSESVPPSGGSAISDPTDQGEPQCSPAGVYPGGCR